MTTPMTRHIPGETGMVVLHDIGDAAGRRTWTAALEGAGWPGDVVVAALPGHGDAPAPVGGDYELPDAAVAGLRAVTSVAGDGRPALVGVGANGWAAQLLALAGRISALVLVDGLGGPWAEPTDAIDRSRRWLRAVADDPDAVAPAPETGMDPRLRHGLVPHGSRGLAHKAAIAMPVPVLLIETPLSPIPADEADDLAGRFRCGATLVRMTTTDLDTVAGAIVGWAVSN